MSISLSYRNGRIRLIRTSFRHGDSNTNTHINQAQQNKKTTTQAHNANNKIEKTIRK